MENVLITLNYQAYSVDLELPDKVPFFTLAPTILRAMNWENGEPNDDANQFIGQLKSDGAIIQPTETLAQAGVVDGDIIELKRPTSKPAPLVNQPHLISIDTNDVLYCDKNVTMIGRNDVSQLPNSHVVSSRHAKILHQSNGFMIQDESTNGTFVDGVELQPNQPYRLKNGCEIQLGVTGPIMVFYTGHTH